MAADDTDVFLLLVNHFETNTVDIYFISEKPRRCGISPRLQTASTRLLSITLFLHASTGCDGKTSLVKKIKLSNGLQRIGREWSESFCIDVRWKRKPRTERFQVC